MKIARFLLISALLFIGIPHDKLPPHEEQKIESLAIWAYPSALYSLARRRFMTFRGTLSTHGHLDAVVKHADESIDSYTDVGSGNSEY